MAELKCELHNDLDRWLELRQAMDKEHRPEASSGDNRMLFRQFVDGHDRLSPKPTSKIHVALLRPLACEIGASDLFLVPGAPVNPAATGRSVICATGFSAFRQRTQARMLKSIND